MFLLCPRCYADAGTRTIDAIKPGAPFSFVFSPGEGHSRSVRSVVLLPRACSGVATTEKLSRQRHRCLNEPKLSAQVILRHHKDTVPCAGVSRVSSALVLPRRSFIGRRQPGTADGGDTTSARGRFHDYRIRRSASKSSENSEWSESL